MISRLPRISKTWRPDVTVFKGFLATLQISGVKVYPTVSCLFTSFIFSDYADHIVNLIQRLLFFVNVF